VAALVVGEAAAGYLVAYSHSSPFLSETRILRAGSAICPSFPRSMPFFFSLSFRRHACVLGRGSRTS
jgi:hypothetical protein